MTALRSTTDPVGAEQNERELGSGLGWVLRDSWNEATRHLRAVPRNPDVLLFLTIQPLMFVLLFRYVFGGAIQIPGFRYEQYLVPGVFAQTVVFGSVYTAIGLAEDSGKGFIDRLRSLPISRASVLIGRTVSDLVRNLISFAVMLAVAFAVGFRFEGGLLDGLLGDGGAVRLQLRLLLDPGVDRTVGLQRRGGELGRLHLDVPDDLHLLRVRRDRDDAELVAPDRRRQPVHDRDQHGTGAVQRQAGRRFALAVDRLGRRPDGRLRLPRDPKVLPSGSLSSPAGRHRRVCRPAGVVGLGDYGRVVTDEPLAIPSPCLVVLIGPIASGKSTWAKHWFEPSQIVSSDGLRAMVGEGEHDLAASTDAFAVLDEIVARRLRRRLTTVVDSLGTDAVLRARWRALAEAVGVPSIAVVFDTAPAECRRRNAARPVPVSAVAVSQQLARWPAVREEVANEPWTDLLDPSPVTVVPANLVIRRPAAVRPTAPRTVPTGAAADPARPAGIAIGLQLSSFGWPGGPVALAGHLRRIAADAEQIGIEHLWVMDHLRQIPQVGPAWSDLPETYTTLATLAAATARVRLGALVSPAFLRPAAILADLVATLDVLSGGRAICGLGVGWFEQEYRTAGIAFPSLAERYAALGDALESLPLWWGKGSPPYTGRVAAVTETLCYPRPLQARVPIWVGGSGERRTLRLVAERADGCNLFGEPDVVATKVAALRRHCDEVGRDPAEIEISQLSTVVVGRSRSEVAELVDGLRPPRRTAERFAREVNAGTVDDHLRRLERFAEAGAGTVIVSLPDVAHPGALERLAPLVERARGGY